MMDNVLLDYVVFFEVEPKLLYPSQGWYYGAQFDTQRGDNRILATIAPEEGEFIFKWWQADILRADFTLIGIVNWQITSKPNHDVLSLRFSQPCLGDFIFQLKPEISFHMQTSWA